MKEIPLSRGKVALVDDEDFERCMTGYKWSLSSQHGLYPRFYATRNDKWVAPRKFSRQSLSRFIMGITDRKFDVDHINHDTLDNRKENLRVCSHRQNLQNMNIVKSSRFPGVRFDHKSQKWSAQIWIGGKLKHLGQFTDEREAAKAYERAVRATGEELVCKMRVPV